MLALPCQLREREGAIQTAPLGWGGGARPAPVLSGPLPPFAAPHSPLTLWGLQWGHCGPTSSMNQVPTPESPSIRSEASDSCSFPLGKCLEVKGLSLRFNPRAEVVLPPVESNRHRALQTLFQAMCCPRPRGRKEGTLES